jgi:hypothetical protein
VYVTSLTRDDLKDNRIKFSYLRIPFNLKKYHLNTLEMTSSQHPRIEITPYKTIQNPCNKAPLFKYDGDILTFPAFNKQQKNYENLQASLAPFGLSMTHIYAGIFPRKKGGTPLHFVATEPSKQVVWQKYESDGYGSGQNYLFFKGNLIRLTKWLKMSHNDRIKLIDEYQITCQTPPTQKVSNDPQESNEQITP